MMFEIRFEILTTAFYYRDYKLHCTILKTVARSIMRHNEKQLNLYNDTGII